MNDTQRTPLVFGFSPISQNNARQCHSTPASMALSLGATMGGQELSWSSSMATPIAEDLESGTSESNSNLEDGSPDPNIIHFSRKLFNSQKLNSSLDCFGLENKLQWDSPEAFGAPENVTQGTAVPDSKRTCDTELSKSSKSSNSSPLVRINPESANKKTVISNNVGNSAPDPCLNCEGTPKLSKVGVRIPVRNFLLDLQDGGLNGSTEADSSPKLSHAEESALEFSPSYPSTQSQNSNTINFEEITSKFQNEQQPKSPQVHDLKATDLETFSNTDTTKPDVVIPRDQSNCDSETAKRGCPKNPVTNPESSPENLLDETTKKREEFENIKEYVILENMITPELCFVQPFLPVSTVNELVPISLVQLPLGPCAVEVTDESVSRTESVEQSYGQNVCQNSAQEPDSEEIAKRNHSLKKLENCSKTGCSPVKITLGDIIRPQVAGESESAEPENSAILEIKRNSGKLEVGESNCDTSFGSSRAEASPAGFVEVKSASSSDVKMYKARTNFSESVESKVGNSESDEEIAAEIKNVCSAGPKIVSEIPGGFKSDCLELDDDGNDELFRNIPSPNHNQNSFEAEKDVQAACKSPKSFSEDGKSDLKMCENEHVLLQGAETPTPAINREKSSAMNVQKQGIAIKNGRGDSENGAGISGNVTVSSGSLPTRGTLNYPQSESNEQLAKGNGARPKTHNVGLIGANENSRKNSVRLENGEFDRCKEVEKSEDSAKIICGGFTMVSGRPVTTTTDFLNAQKVFGTTDVHELWKLPNLSAASDKPNLRERDSGHKNLAMCDGFTTGNGNEIPVSTEKWIHDRKKFGECATTDRKKSRECAATDRKESRECATTYRKEFREFATTDRKESRECATTDREESRECTIIDQRKSRECATAVRKESRECATNDRKESRECAKIDKNEFRECAKFPCGGFTMASGKPVSTKAALLNAKRIFGEEDIVELMKFPSLPMAASGKPNSDRPNLSIGGMPGLKDTSVCKAKKCLENVAPASCTGFAVASKQVATSASAVNGTSPCFRPSISNRLKGFEMASGKAVQLSKTAIKLAQSVFKEDDLSDLWQDSRTEDAQDSMTGKKDGATAFQKGTDLENNIEFEREFDNNEDWPEADYHHENKRQKVTSMTRERATAGAGRKPSMSNEVQSPLAASELLTYPQFTLASGKLVSTSKAAMEKAKSIFSEEDLQQISELRPPFASDNPVDEGGDGVRCPMFLTASQKVAPVSEFALRQVRSGSNDSNTRKNVPRCISGEGNFCNKPTEETRREKAASNRLQTFVTASQKVASVSEVALRQVRADSNDDTSCKDVPRCISEAGDFCTKLNEATVSNRFQPFLTASQKVAPLSEIALRQVCADSDNGTTCKDVPRCISEAGDLCNKSTEEAEREKAASNRFQPFLTASQKVAPVYEIALQQIRGDSDYNSTCKDVPRCISKAGDLCNKSPEEAERVKAASNRLQPFLTASQKVAPVSEIALRQVRGDSDYGTTCKDVPRCFSEAGNLCKKPTVDARQEKAASNQLQPFLTASQKVAPVSEIALRQVRADSDYGTTCKDVPKCIYEAEPTEEAEQEKAASNRLQPFLTASQKVVLVSESALKQVQTCLDSGGSKSILGVDDFCNGRASGSGVKRSSSLVLEEECAKRSKSDHQDRQLSCGFSSASGRPVAVSEKALAVVRMSHSQESDAQVVPSGSQASGQRSLNCPTEDWNSISEEFSHDMSEEMILADLGQAPAVPEMENQAKNTRSEQMTAEVLESTVAFLADDMTPPHSKGLKRSSIWLSPIQTRPNKLFSSAGGAARCAILSQEQESPLRQDSTMLEDLEKPFPVLAEREYGWRSAACESVPIDVQEMRQLAVEGQLMRIAKRKRMKVLPVPGILWQKKQSREDRLSLRKAVDGKRPQRLDHNKCLQCGIKMSTLKVTYSNAEEYKFLWEEHYDDSRLSDIEVDVGGGCHLIFDEKNMAGKNEFYRSFLDSPGIDSHLIDQKWVFNHYRWIVWKLAAMEVSFPEKFGGRLLTPDEVMMQLNYRYNCEIDFSRRSALKRIVERDDTPAKTLVLCVVSIHEQLLCSKEESSILDSASTSTALDNDKVIEVSDGWYSIKATLDKPLVRLVKSGQICVGLKIVVHGAELIGPSEPCPPLEAPASLALKLSANCCRRARWHTPLGYLPCPKPFPLPLMSLFADGGMVGCSHMLVARVYPTQYLEKLDDGVSVVYNDRTNSVAAHQFESRKSMLMEKIVGDVQKIFDQQEASRENLSKTSFGKLNSRDEIRSLVNGVEIYEALENSADPSLIEDLSKEQLNALAGYKDTLMENHRSKFEAEIQRAVDNQKEKCPVARNVVPFLKIRAVGTMPKDLVNNTSCLITIWNPSPDVECLLKEGKAIRAYYLMAEARSYGLMRGQELQLKSTKRTKFEEIPQLDDAIPRTLVQRKLTVFQTISSTGFSPPFGEIDIIGLVVHIGHQEQSQFDFVYMADPCSNLVVIKFWGGIKSFGLDSLLQTGTSILATNLQWRGRVVSSTLNYLYASELSTFSQHPKDPKYKIALSQFESSFTNMATFIDRVKAKISSITKNGGTNQWGKTFSTPSPLAFGKPACTSTPNAKYRCATAMASRDIVQQKLQQLGKYGPPSPLPSLITHSSPILRTRFQSPKIVQKL